MTRQTPTLTPLPANITRSPSGLGYLYQIINGCYIRVNWILNAHQQRSQWSYITKNYNIYFLSNKLTKRVPTAEDQLPPPLHIITPGDGNDGGGGGGGDGGGSRPPSLSGLSDDGGFSDGSRDTWRPVEPGGWTERRERGNKLEKFQGDMDKSEAFLLDFDFVSISSVAF